jgi:hypothetical protein
MWRLHSVWQEQRGLEPSTVTKMALGCFCVALLDTDENDMNVFA